MPKLLTIADIARRYACTRAAVSWRAKVRGIAPDRQIGRSYLFTPAAAKRLGPGRRGRPPKAVAPGQDA